MPSSRKKKKKKKGSNSLGSVASSKFVATADQVFSFSLSSGGYIVLRLRPVMATTPYQQLPALCAESQLHCFQIASYLLRSVYMHRLFWYAVALKKKKCWRLVISKSAFCLQKVSTSIAQSFSSLAYSVEPCTAAGIETFQGRLQRGGKGGDCPHNLKIYTH